VERLRFNVCIATIYEFANILGAAVGAIDEGAIGDDLRFAFAEAGDILVQLFAPMMPHLAEECWSVLGHEGLIAEAAWPTADRALVVRSLVTMPVQVNGRKRAELTIDRQADDKTVEAAALSLDAVRRALDNRGPKKVIIVPQRIVNVVV
jgi:leucyl-tRNA synthetase